MSATLKQVVRQAEESGILWNATHLRKLMDTEQVFSLPQLRFKGFADVMRVTGSELIEVIEECYHRDGEDETIVVTRSNTRAIAYNNGIRARILWREEPIEGGDIMMGAKNNYFWTVKLNAEFMAEALKEGKSPEQAECTPFDFIANGDTAVVRRLRNERSFYGFTFADAELEFPDYDNYSMQVTVLTDTLQAEAPALTKEQQEKLFTGIMEDSASDPTLRSKQDKLKALRQDPYYNALQIKYAYAITCHKAQGGQWTNVFIDQGFMTEDMLGPDYFRWLDTALTRASTRVYFVNWKDEQVENNKDNQKN